MLARRYKHKIIAGDVADEIARPADASDHFADDGASLANHGVGFGVAVVIVESFEVIEIKVPYQIM